MHNVFLLGAARAGTTAVAELIARAFGLALVRGKETHYLASLDIGRRSGGPHGKVFDRARETNLRGFERRLTSQTQPFLDASTSSLYYGRSAAELLGTTFADARLVAILRNPTDRAISAYRYLTARGFETTSWEEALSLEEERIENRFPHIWHYRAQGMYSHQIEALGNIASRVLWLVYEQDLADTHTLLDRIASHIEMPVLSYALPERRNSAPNYRSAGAARIVERVRSYRFAQRLPKTFKERVRHAFEDVEAPSGWSVNSFNRGPLSSLVLTERDKMSDFLRRDLSGVWRV